MNTSLQKRLTEIEKFVAFTTIQWPELRTTVADQLAQRCQRCILSERYTPIREGVCDICRMSDEPESAARSPDKACMEEALHDILRQHEGKGTGHYDALVLFSGGKDSVFLLHRLRSEFPGLRLLAVTVDNGFFSQVAMANCRHVLQRLQGVDHLFYRPQTRLFVKTFRHALTNLNEGGCYTTVDRMDGDLTFDIGRHLTVQWGAPLMISGLSPGQAERILGLNTFQTLPEEERKKRTHSAGFALEIIYDTREIGQYWWDGTAIPQHQLPRVLYPFYAWNYDEEFIRDEVVRLGLIEPGQDNPLATNNDTIPVMLAVDTCILGYSGFEPEFAELVRSAKADRDFWLFLFQSIEYLAKRGRFMPHSIAETLRRLGLAHEEVGLPRPALNKA